MKVFTHRHRIPPHSRALYFDMADGTPSPTPAKVAAIKLRRAIRPFIHERKWISLLVSRSSLILFFTSSLFDRGSNRGRGQVPPSPANLALFHLPSLLLSYFRPSSTASIFFSISFRPNFHNFSSFLLVCSLICGVFNFGSSRGESSVRTVTQFLILKCVPARTIA